MFLSSVILPFTIHLIMSRLYALHPSQTAYFKGRSCLDGIFATNEVLTKLLSEGDSPYLCLFDLEKAFDSVEYNVLLHLLYASGVNGKTWCIIKSWYANPICAVRFNRSVSASFSGCDTRCSPFTNTFQPGDESSFAWFEQR